VYIDKPLATSVSEAQRIYGMEKYPGQVFSCSALRYSNDLTLTSELREKTGTVVYVHATTMKYWDTYSVHIIEPTLKLMGISDSPVKVSSSSSADRKTVCATWADGKQAVFSTLGNTPAPIKIQVFGEKSNVELLFEDTFHSFRQALRSFVEGVRERREMIPREEVLRVVELIEKGSAD
jgi:predicted dehydrogenase